MSDLDMEHSVDISHTPSVEHKQWCIVNIRVTETHNLKAEVAPDDVQVLDIEGSPDNFLIPSILFTFDDLRSTSCCYRLCKQKLSSLEEYSPMLPTTRKVLVENLAESLAEHMMNLVSLCDPEDINAAGFFVDARLDVDYYRLADEDDLAPYRLFDELDRLMEEEEEEDGDDVAAMAATLFRIVNDREEY